MGPRKEYSKTLDHTSSLVRFIVTSTDVLRFYSMYFNETFTINPCPLRALIK